MTPEQLKNQLERQRTEVASLTELWLTVVGSDCPVQRQFFLWLSRHSFHVVAVSIQETGAKKARRGAMDTDHAVRFASRVMNEKAAA
jgi:hypothetical protein